MSQAPRPIARRSGMEAERQWRDDLDEHERDHEEEDDAHAEVAEAEEEGVEPGVGVDDGAQVHASAPGGPALEGIASPVLGAAAHAAAGAAAADDDDLLCVICLQTCVSEDEIWSCDVCALVSHLECIRGWLQESEAKGRFGRCPACSASVCSSFELVYSCWCKRVCWSGDAAGGDEGQAPSHSCGAVCARERLESHACPHPCADVCHRGRCKPCGHTRAGVRCVGDHVTYDPFPCGSDPSALCALPCGAELPCGHRCAASCHGADKPHAACMQPVPRDCACGKTRADGPAASRLLAPCSQKVVQCDVPCGRTQQCGQHVCERRCHTGDCQELMVVSAWNKGGWIKVGAAGAAAAAAPVPARPAVAEDASFPALGASPAAAPAARRAPAQPVQPAAPQPTSRGAFTSCGKVCNRRRSCGHPCAQTCHAIAASSSVAVPAPSSSTGASRAAGSEAKESEEAAGKAAPAPAAPECDAVACTQLVHVSCPCGRKSDSKVRCSERSKRAGLALCDHVCAVHAQGRLFDAELVCAAKEDPVAFGELRTMIPWPATLLALLCGGSSVAALAGGGGGGGGGSAHAAATEAQFLRKTETQVRKFVVDMAATLDREGAAAAAAAASCPPTPSASAAAAPALPKYISAAAACMAVAPVRHLFLSGLTPARRQMVAQLALACNLHFDGDTGLEALPAEGASARRAGGAGVTVPPTPAPGTPPRSRRDNAEERKEKEEAGGASAVPLVQDPLAALSVSNDSAAPSSAVTFLLPSQSLVAAADLYKQASHLPSLCTADTWPSSLRVRVHFDGDDQRAMERADPGRQLQRWLAPWAARCRPCWVGGRTVSVLFASPLVAHQCYVHLTRAFAAEMAGARVQLEAPGVSAAPAVRAALAAEEVEAAALRRVEADTRHAAQEEFAALQERVSKQRAANPAPSVSILPTAPTGRQSVTAVRSIVGHAKIKIKASNMFDLLGEEEDE